MNELQMQIIITKKTGGENTPYDVFYNKNIEIGFNEDSFEEWIEIAKTYLIQSEFDEYIKYYIKKDFNLNKEESDKKFDELFKYLKNKTIFK